MKEEYNFSCGQRGPVILHTEHKEKITIRLDTDILTWFRGQVHNAGGGSYQTMINDALRQYIAHQDIETTLRRVIREEMQIVK